ncbi:MAG: 50S ribosomal protein L7/L12 [Chloroflexota bacterium]|nr:50S ribosomal protein L7/L12 [Chloroflexota bacterium]NOG63505.1 50S ribosomal protein L7/L12 [Chloroflexota bacterium]GIK62784.1 MAG: 50S ribosomal protein L7/L12 [Chloroflexota bacterium]
MADLAKIVDELSSLTILEAAELKTLLEEKWGVTAAAPMAMMAAMPMGMAGGGEAAAAEPAEEPTEFNVVLKDAGPKKINVIKVIRSLTTLGLAEAKAAAENPGTLLEGVSKEAAADAKSKLEAEGAVIEVKPA